MTSIHWRHVQKVTIIAATPIVTTASSVVPYTMSISARRNTYKSEHGSYTYYLFCNNFYLCNNLSILDLLSDYSCIRHENGTLCEDLLERYFPGDLYDNAIANYGYESDPNRSCYNAEYDQECLTEKI